MGVLKTAVFISLPILGLCAVVLYLIHKKEEDDLHDTLQDVKTSRFKTIEMKIPKTVVGVIIGRAGSNIKEVQQKTDTRINFKDHDDDDEYRTCYIRGTAEDTQVAEVMLHAMIMSQPIIEVHETWVPLRATGKIIGRGGENIRTITRVSNAKINVEPSTSNTKAETKIVIKGTTEQIGIALSLIQEKVDEDVELRRNMQLCQAKRSPRNKPKSNSPSLAEPEKNKKIEISDYINATGSDGILQVFVSAVSSPVRFWIQVYSSRAVELDHLVEEMTEYYCIEDNKTLHIIKELEVGQIVAAPHNQDNRWYRAEVRDLYEDKVDVYYVDYGDSDYLQLEQVLQLRTDFLKLRFQAIECSLAHIKSSEGDNWSEVAVDVFEDLCHVAQWKPLMAKVVSCGGDNRSMIGGSTVPQVALYDTSGTEDINISEELVKQGFAVNCDTVPVDSPKTVAS